MCVLCLYLETHREAVKIDVLVGQNVLQDTGAECCTGHFSFLQQLLCCSISYKPISKLDFSARME